MCAWGVFRRACTSALSLSRRFSCALVWGQPWVIGLRSRSLLTHLLVCPAPGPPVSDASDPVCLCAECAESDPFPRVQNARRSRDPRRHAGCRQRPGPGHSQGVPDRWQPLQLQHHTRPSVPGPRPQLGEFLSWAKQQPLRTHTFLVFCRRQVLFKQCDSRWAQVRFLVAACTCS